VTRSFGPSRPSSDVADVGSDARGARGELVGRRAGRPGPRPPRRLGFALVLAGVGLTATACDEPNFGFPSGITPQAHRMLNIWQGSFIAALIVGILVWGLIFYACFAFRKTTDEMPAQIRYNLPVEILYTVLPIVVIAGLFYYTARDEIKINKVSKNPAVTINVVGFRWNWQFIYSDTGKNGTLPVEVTGRPGEPAQLVLPEGRTVKFVLTSPDVIHSFWVPDFLFKRDVVPGRINQFQVTIDKTGTFIGRCAEFCGVDHDRMNFQVKVIPGSQYDQFIAARSNTRGVTASASTTSTSSTSTSGTSTTGSGQ
jgi:cytochrome c oxidase subunit 2